VPEKTISRTIDQTTLLILEHKNCSAIQVIFKVLEGSIEVGRQPDFSRQTTELRASRWSFDGLQFGFNLNSPMAQFRRQRQPQAPVWFRIEDSCNCAHRRKSTRLQSVCKVGSPNSKSGRYFKHFPASHYANGLAIVTA
jgi:hypothetical protein